MSFNCIINISIFIIVLAIGFKLYADGVADGDADVAVTMGETLGGRGYCCVKMSEIKFS